MMTPGSRILILVSLLLCRVAPLQAQDSIVVKTGLKDLTVQQYNKLINRSDKTVLVNFSADWCVVCKRQKPVLDQLAEKHKTDLLLLEIDMDDNPLIAEFFEVDGLPANIIYTNGHMMWNRVGFQNLPALENALWLYKPDKEKNKEK